MMITIKDYLDSTYLETPEQAGISEEETIAKVKELIHEAIHHQFFSVMIRPDYVKLARTMLDAQPTTVQLGTVVGFHQGTASIQEKMIEAQKAIDDGADELDFVINFRAYLAGDIEQVQKEVEECTNLALNEGKITKWIIEIAALNNDQIADITSKISHWLTIRFPEDVDKIFIKSSTGFYKTEDGKPNGATVEGIKIMLQNAGKLPVKAAGGVRTPEKAIEMITLGVKRIGTSSAKALIGLSTKQQKEIKD